MTIDSAVVNVIRDRLSKANRILITSHIRPDGDAVGSLLGLGLALKNSGKQVEMVLADPVPHNFLHLEGSRDIKRGSKGEFDTVIAVDASDLKRVGGLVGERQPDIQIDHHITNLNFAAINLVDPDAVATTAILTEIMEPLGLAINPPVARALLTGLVTDTIGFRTSNMTPKALRLAAKLMDCGANLSELYYHGLVVRSYEAARYWGVGLSTLQKKGRMIWATLTQTDRLAVGYNGNDDADLTNMLSSISEADVAVLFIEQKDKHVKVSWRAISGLDISKIALVFGGGGHPAASGADIAGSLEEVQERVLTVTEAFINKEN